MEIVAVIGVIASAFTIWDFIVVRLKKQKALKGIQLKQFMSISQTTNNIDCQLSGYRIPNEDDLKKGDWSWVYDGATLPFITYGNFFGDGKLSEALILIGIDNGEAQIVVRRYGERKFMKLMSPTSSPYNIQLKTVPIGEYSSYWEKLNLKLETHAIKISFLESAEVILYWDNTLSAFKEYWTAD